jgi:hypothetical protein
MNAETLMYLFGLNEYCVRVNTEGFSNADSLIQPEDSGNCTNWLLGHIVSTRHKVLQLLGEDPVWSKDQRKPFMRGSSPVTGEPDAVPFDTITDAFNRSQLQLTSGLKRVSEADLSQVVDGESLYRKLITFHFHEAYHAGQLGLLRRIAGKEGAIK